MREDFHWLAVTVSPGTDMAEPTLAERMIEGRLLETPQILHRLDARHEQSGCAEVEVRLDHALVDGRYADERAQPAPLGGNDHPVRRLRRDMAMLGVDHDEIEAEPPEHLDELR